MREVDLLKKFFKSYRLLNLSYMKLIGAFLFMGLTSVLEMAGLSILYPLVLMLGSNSHSTIISSFDLNITVEHKIFLMFLCVGVLFFLKNLALYFTYNNNINFSVYCYRNFVKGIYSAFVNKPVLNFREESHGYFAQTVCVQTQKLIDGVLRPFLVVITEMLVLAGISSLLFFISPGLMISIIVVCAGSACIFYWLMRNRASRWGRQEMEAASNLQDIVNNTAAGISEIKIFNKEDYLTTQVEKIIEEKTRMFHHLEMFQQGPRFIIETVFVLTMVSFLAALLLMGTDTTILLAQFSVIAAASFRMLPSINRVVNSYSNFSFNLSPAIVLLDDVVKFKFQNNLSRYNSERSVDKTFEIGTINFKDISFEYPNSSIPILDNINLEIKKGQRIGVFGKSGSGKSTFIEILAGLYRQTSGDLLVDGRPIETILINWQSRIGYVPQVSFILPESIRENIIFGSDQDRSDFEVWGILKQVGLEKYITSLPIGLETYVGPKGISLSGGQKQLVCLARALLRDPQMLLLDEPTASLDNVNEQIVLNAINELPEDVTVVMVSHKLENFKNFDVIFHCEKGRFIKVNYDDINNRIELTG